MKKRKIKKSIESFEKRILEHENKIKEYKEKDGRNETLIGYWQDEIEKFKKFKKEKEEKLGDNDE
jgi:chromosome segregation ATPase